MSQQALNLGDRNSQWENSQSLFNERRTLNSDYKFVESSFVEEYSVGNIKNKICSAYSSKEEVIKFKLMIKKSVYKGSIKKLKKIKVIIDLYYYY